MTIDEAFRYVEFVSNKSQRGSITPKEFNLLAERAQLAHIQEVYGNGYVSTQKQQDTLKKLIKSQSSALGSGYVSIPSDSLYILSVSLADGTNVKMVSEDQISKYRKSKIVAPSESDPIGYIQENRVYVLPSTITSNIVIKYVDKPTAPVWNYTVSNNRAVYSSSGSQDFEAGEVAHNDIVNKILEYLGMNTRDVAVTQYAMSKQAVK
jgi:hypothetical protein